MESTVKHCTDSSSVIRPLTIIGLVLLLTFSVFGETAAQGDEPTEDEVNTIAEQLYCPVCENVPLDVCGTQACAQWRATIRKKLAAGWNEKQIKQYFSNQYGVRVLAQPPTQGFNALFWALPPVAFLVSAFFVLRFIRNIRRKQQPADGQPAAEQANADDYVARLERELEQWR